MDITKHKNTLVLNGAVKLIGTTLRKITSHDELKAYTPTDTEFTAYNKERSMSTLVKLRQELKIN